MAAAVQQASTRYLYLSNREARLLLAAVSALFIGYTSEQGLPGSVLAIGVAVPLAAMMAAQFNNGWTRTTYVGAAINLAALGAVALEPGPLNLSVMWFSLVGFALVRQGASPSNIQLIAKTSLHTLGKAPLGFIREFKIIRVIRNRNRLHPRSMTLASILPPIAAISVFGLLLITANPLIESAVTQISWGASFGFLLSWMPLVTAIAFILTSAILNMRPSKNQTVREGIEVWRPQYFMPVPVIITLLTLNAMFLSENILDMQYVWTGAALPDGMNYAEYVHRGSYTLIVTAILAGALVIIALQPGSKSEASPIVRWLVYFWTAQNVFLVASSAKRTLSYIDAYGMTLWRLSGLIWMGLVAAGLIFIAARVITRRGNLWLINVNLGTAFVVLLVCGLTDFKAIVADWNVERALAQLGPFNKIQSIDLDLDYLAELGPASIIPLTGFEALTPSDQSIWTAKGAMSTAAPALVTRLCNDLFRTQTDWRTWTLRGFTQEFNSICDV